MLNETTDIELQSVLSRYRRGDQSVLIPVLQAVQEELRYLSPNTIQEISRYLGISLSEAYGVASFYSQFRFSRPGDHTVKVCLGTACHVRRGDLIMETFERELGIHDRETTADGKFSLERVACFGCCALAPVVVVDKEIHGRMRSTGVRKLLKKFEAS